MPDAAPPENQLLRTSLTDPLVAAGVIHFGALVVETEAVALPDWNVPVEGVTVAVHDWAAVVHVNGAFTTPVTMVVAFPVFWDWSSCTRSASSSRAREHRTVPLATAEPYTESR